MQKTICSPRLFYTALERLLSGPGQRNSEIIIIILPHASGYISLYYQMIAEAHWQRQKSHSNDLSLSQFISVSTLHDSRIWRKRGIMVSGPREQFRPTTAAPASSNFRHASENGTWSTVSSGLYGVSVITAGNPGDLLKHSVKLGSWLHY